MNGRRLENYWFQGTERMTTGNKGIGREQIKKKNRKVYGKTR